MDGKKTGFLLKLFVAATFLAMVVVNVLANLLPINGITTGAVSDSYPNLFTPAALTFSVWGLIYLLLAVHTLYQIGLLRGKDKTNEVLLRKIGVIFSISSLVNTAWIFAWHYKLIVLSAVLIVILLICLIAIATLINAQPLSTREKVLIRLPFSVYFGWITVATIANITTMLVYLGWNGFGIPESAWTIVILAIGALIGVLTMLRFKDIAYGLVLMWAYLGILIKHADSSGFSGQYPGVIIAVSACLAVFAAVEISILFNQNHR